MSKIAETIELANNIRQMMNDKDPAVTEELLDIENELSKLNVNFNTAVNIESVPGARTPKWYTLDIAFDGGETQAKSRAFEISSEGAFLPTSLQVYFKYVSNQASDYLYSNLFPFTDLPQGRYVSASTFPIFGNGILQNPVDMAGSSPVDSTLITVGGYQQAMYDIPEFSFGFELETVNQTWVNRPIPGGLIFTLDNPLYFSGETYLDRTERLIVTAYPDIRVPVSGVVRLVLHGYQILGEITPEDQTRI
tara:strand:- start:188 stop:937 length:750 start_codon:yes stop_codon:yes gene_type:complete